MNLNKFTHKAQEALVQAQTLAGDYSHSQIEPEHLLLALLTQEDGVVPQIVQRIGISPALLQGELEQALAGRAKAYGATMQVGLSRALQEVLRQAEKEASGMRDEYVSTEHLLLALAGRKAGDSSAALRRGPWSLGPRTKGSGQGSGQAVSAMLGRRGVTHSTILEALTAIRGSQRVTDPNPEDKYQALEKYGRNLTQLARQGKLDPVIGRTVVIMTSNVGSQYIRDLAGDDDAVREQVTRALNQHFRPEFLNRIDEVVIFHSLTREHLAQIVDIQLERLQTLLAERHITLELTGDAKHRLAEEGYDPVYGARPLKRVIQRRVQDPLALKLLQSEFLDGDAIRVDAQDGELIFRQEEA